MIRRRYRRSSLATLGSCVPTRSMTWCTCRAGVGGAWWRSATRYMEPRPASDRGLRWHSRTRWCWPGACATRPTIGRHLLFTSAFGNRAPSAWSATRRRSTNISASARIRLPSGCATRWSRCSSARPPATPPTAGSTTTRSTGTILRTRKGSMRRLINSTYITLDGVIEGPHLWPSPDQPSDERGEQIQTDLLLSCDALLMGRRTYAGFAPVWVTRSGDPYSDYINAMPKYVVSTTLKDPEWQN